jgi:hypothetical protein
MTAVPVPPYEVPYVFSPVGDLQVHAVTGDVILCHRKGFASRVIRIGEAFRYGAGSYWSHMAFVDVMERPLMHVPKRTATVIEALTGGIRRTPLEDYRPIEFVLVRTSLFMSEEDRQQASAFAQTCIDEPYDWLDDVGIALRFLTPGSGLWFGMNGTEMCSGLCLQALCRSWFNFRKNPASMSPAEAAIELGVPASLHHARERPYGL